MYGNRKSNIDHWIIGNHYEVEVCDDNNNIVINEEMQEPIKIQEWMKITAKNQLTKMCK